MIKHKNEETLHYLVEYSKAQQNDLERRQKEENRAQFDEVASKLHHLVSTTVIPGVYNNSKQDGKPQVYNADVETHLVSVFKVIFVK
jgi:hypothetical protein